MNSKYLLGLCAALVLAVSANPVFADGSADLLVHPTALKLPPLVFQQPKAHRNVLSNGLVVFTLPDHEIPLVYMRATVRAGAYLEPDDKLGLAELCGAVLRTGGTKKSTGDALDEELEFMAAAVESSIGDESGTVTLNVLARDLDHGLNIFRDVLTEPAFAADKIELKRQQMLEQIRRRNDQVGAITQREWRRLVYHGHPLGRVSTAATVKAITRDDLVAFHDKCYYPNNVMLAISGDFDETALLKKLEETFGTWAARKGPIPPSPAIPLGYTSSLNYIDKVVPQANIRMGHLCVTRSDPDWHALEVFDSIVGGNGFASRLMREVRSNRGLAYSVGSTITGGRTRGVFLAAAQTKSKSAVETLSLMKSIIADMRDKPVSEEELKTAKDSLLNSFVFQFTSSYGNVTHQADLEYAGLPADWYETYQAKIAAVTIADVQRVARDHIYPDMFTTLVVGHQEDFDHPLGTLGPVQNLPLVDYSH